MGTKRLNELADHLIDSLLKDEGDKSAKSEKNSETVSQDDKKSDLLARILKSKETKSWLSEQQKAEQTLSRRENISEYKTPTKPVNQEQASKESPYKRVAPSQDVARPKPEIVTPVSAGRKEQAITNRPDPDKTETVAASEPMPPTWGRGELTLKDSGRKKERMEAETGTPPSRLQLKQSENLRVAQQRILDLEREIEILRYENEKLVTVGETLRRRVEELTREVEQSTNKQQQLIDKYEIEMSVLKDNYSFKEREAQEYKTKNQEIESRLSADFKKIRVRERELQNRLELMKLENSAVLRSKDETILNLKRQIDNMASDSEIEKAKIADLQRRYELDQERMRRTVRALRLALSNLESKSGDGGGTNQNE